MIQAISFYERAQQLDRAAAIVCDEVTNAAQAQTLNSSTIVLLNDKLNEKHNLMRDALIEAAREIATRIEEVVKSIGPEEAPNELIRLAYNLVAENSGLLSAIYVDDAADNPVSAINEGADYPPSTLQNSFMHIENAISTFMNTIKAAEEKAKSTAVSDRLGPVFANMRIEGLLPRNFALDLSDVAQKHVDDAFDVIEKQAGKAAWASDLMNALTQAIEDMTADDYKDRQVASHFFELVHFVHSMVLQSARRSVFAQSAWDEAIAVAKQKADDLKISIAAKEDILKALSRLHLGNSNDKKNVITAIQAMYENLAKLCNPKQSFCDCWWQTRQMLRRAQNSLAFHARAPFEATEERLRALARKHENCFAQLQNGVKNNAVKEWLQMQYEKLQGIRNNIANCTRTKNPQSTLQNHYIAFWQTLNREISSQYLQSGSLWGKRDGFAKAIKNLNITDDDLSKLGVTFAFSQHSAKLLLSLLEKNWVAVYRFSPISRNVERDKIYEVLKTKLAQSKSPVEALHHLSESAALMLSQHAQHSTAYNLWFTQRGSRGVQALTITLREASFLRLVPKESALHLSTSINIIQSQLGAYFKSLWLGDKDKQAEMHGVLMAIYKLQGLHIAGELSDSDAAARVIGLVDEKYAALQNEYGGGMFNAALRVIGWSKTHPYLKAWERTRDAVQAQYSKILEDKAWVLRRLGQLHSTFNSIERDGLQENLKAALKGNGGPISFAEAKEEALKIVRSLCKVVDKHNLDFEALAYVLNRAFENINALSDKRFLEPFEVALQEILERGRLKPEPELKADEAQADEAQAEDLLTNAMDKDYEEFMAIREETKKLKAQVRGKR